MEDQEDAYKAIQTLNFYELTDSGTYLTVNWQFDYFGDLQKSAILQKERQANKFAHLLNETENQTLKSQKEDLDYESNKEALGNQ